jgi:hypothetical protein
MLGLLPACNGVNVRAATIGAKATHLGSLRISLMVGTRSRGLILLLVALGLLNFQGAMALGLIEAW